jgi:superfamily II DNA or RNA helicase
MTLEALCEIAYRLVRTNPVLFTYSLRPQRVNMEVIEPYVHQSDLLFRLMLAKPLRALIADEIGLGKTIEALLILRYLERRGTRKTLLLTPRILLKQWRDELVRAGISDMNIHPIERRLISTLRQLGFPDGYYIASMDLAKRDEYIPMLREIGFDTFVVDEVHNVGLKTEREELLRNLVLNADTNVLFLSATPHRGNSKDYLNRLLLLDPSIESPEDSRVYYELTHNVNVFRRGKEVVNEVEGRAVFPKCEFNTLAVETTDDEKEYFETLTSFLRYKIREVTEGEEYSPEALLAVLVQKRALSSPKAALRTFESIVSGMQEKKSVDFKRDARRIVDKIFALDYSDAEVEDEEEDFDTAVAEFVSRYSSVLSEEDVGIIKELIGLAKRIMEDDSKLKVLAELLMRYIAQGMKVVVFTEFKDTLNYIKENLSKYSGLHESDFETVCGADKARFEEIKERFKTEENVKFLVATDVASEGLNLQIANVLINYEAPWSPIKLEQRIGRVWRLGQKKKVDAYTFFMAVRADLDVLDNLYNKLICMNDALSDIRPIVGEKLQMAYRTEVGNVDQLWRNGRVEIAEVTINGKKKMTEFDFGLALIKGKLKEYINDFLYYLQDLNRELSKKRVYPYIKAREIRDNIRKVCGGFETINDFEDEMLALGAKILELQDKPYPIKSARDTVRMLEELRGLKSTLIIVPDEVIGEEYVIVVRAFAEGKVLLEFPVVVDVNKNVLVGIDVLRYLKGLIGQTASPTEMEVEMNPGVIVEAKAKRVVKDIFEDAIALRERYETECLSRGLKTKRLWNNQLEWRTEPVLNILRIGKEGSDSNPVSAEMRAMVERESMTYAIKYEERHGRKVRDVHETEHYDLYSYDTAAEEERYIEVKGHYGQKIFAEMPEKEFELAKKLKKKYFLYIVYDIGKKPTLLCFRDPVESLRVITKPRYILTAG